MADVSISPELVKAEFSRSTEKFHVITHVVGLILNIVWFISDYFVLPDHWVPFLIFRTVVSTVSLALVLTRKQTGLNIYFCMFILVLGISIQNAYMWSVMDLAHLQKHAFAYMVLFIGVGMLVLWDIWYSIVLVIATVISNIIFYVLNSPLTVDEFIINGGLLILTVAIFCVFLIRTRYRLTLNEIKIRLELGKSKEIIEREHNVVLAQNEEILLQKEVLEDKNREITASINYAKRIQTAFIPTEKDFTKHFTDSFVLFKPKDIVSGDFYWVHKTGDVIYYVTADCTGHGVPGGFMTMLGLSFLEDIIEGGHTDDPSKVLDLLRDKIVNTLKQGSSNEENKDGMDLIVCRLDLKKMKLQYAAANNSFYVVRNAPQLKEGKELILLKADKQPCGFFPEPKPFTAREFDLQKGDCIYTLTDGYPDQFGGKKGKKFRYLQLEEMLVKNSDKPFVVQKEILSDTFEDWKGHLDQVDDVLIIGIRV